MYADIHVYHAQWFMENDKGDVGFLSFWDPCDDDEEDGEPPVPGWTTTMPEPGKKERRKIRRTAREEIEAQARSLFNVAHISGILYAQKGRGGYISIGVRRDSKAKKLTVSARLNGGITARKEYNYRMFYNLDEIIEFVLDSHIILDVY